LLLLAPLAACGSEVEQHGSGGSSSTSNTADGSTGIFGSGDCTSICEESKQCPGSPQPPEFDCAKACADSEAQAAKMGCSAEWDVFVDCAGQQDVCVMNNTACQSQASAFLQCVTTYCKNQPNDPSCGGGTGGTGGGG
jgi:hypothetical protein